MEDKNERDCDGSAYLAALACQLPGQPTPSCALIWCAPSLLPVHLFEEVPQLVVAAVHFPDLKIRNGGANIGEGITRPRFELATFVPGRRPWLFSEPAVHMAAEGRGQSHQQDSAARFMVTPERAHVLAG